MIAVSQDIWEIADIHAKCEKLACSKYENRHQKLWIVFYAIYTHYEGTCELTRPLSPLILTMWRDMRVYVWDVSGNVQTFGLALDYKYAHGQWIISQLSSHNFESKNNYNWHNDDTNNWERVTLQCTLLTLNGQYANLSYHSNWLMTSFRIDTIDTILLIRRHQV
jgi:hypothetical protein